MGDFRLYQDVQAYARHLIDTADFDVATEMKKYLAFRMAKAILTETVAEETYVISERPEYATGRARYVAELPDGYWKRFLTYFWDLSEDDLTPKVRKHIITLKRWYEHPGAGIPNQSIDETMGYWA